MVLGATTQKLSLCPYICLSNGGRQILVDKLVDVAIQNRVGAGYGIIGAMILHHLVGVQDVAAYLIAPFGRDMLASYFCQFFRFLFQFSLFIFFFLQFSL